MDEVYTCECGNQSWSIHYNYVRCEICEREYKIKIAISPKEFNVTLKRRFIYHPKESEAQEADK